jgi:hypothetical protein
MWRLSGAPGGDRLEKGTTTGVGRDTKPSTPRVLLHDTVNEYPTPLTRPTATQEEPTASPIMPTLHARHTEDAHGE